MPGGVEALRQQQASGGIAVETVHDPQIRARPQLLEQAVQTAVGTTPIRHHGHAGRLVDHQRRRRLIPDLGQAPIGSAAGRQTGDRRHLHDIADPQSARRQHDLPVHPDGPLGKQLPEVGPMRRRQFRLEQIDELHTATIGFHYQDLGRARGQGANTIRRNSLHSTGLLARRGFPAPATPAAGGFP